MLSFFRSSTSSVTVLGAVDVDVAIALAPGAYGAAV